MNQEEGRVSAVGTQHGAAALGPNVSGLLPDGLFARMLVIVIACVTMAGPRSDPPMPMLTTSVMRRPV